jgi:hypothetical protein
MERDYKRAQEIFGNIRFVLYLDYDDGFIFMTKLLKLDTSNMRLTVRTIISQ